MTRALVTLVLSVALAAPVVAQDDPGKRIEAQVFPPELVMRHARAINLTTEQRKQIGDAVSSAQRELIDLQWEMNAAAEALASALEAPRVEEAATLALLDRVLDLERQVKRRQMALVIRIKNLLTPTQQGRLKELRTQGGS